MHLSDESVKTHDVMKSAFVDITSDQHTQTHTPPSRYDLSPTFNVSAWHSVIPVAYYLYSLVSTIVSRGMVIALPKRRR